MNKYLFIDSVEANFTPDLVYYGFEAMILALYFMDKEITSSLEEFLYRWTPVFLWPIVLFPVASPFLTRHSKFVAKSFTGIPPHQFQNPNQRNALITIIAAGMFEKYPIGAIALFLVSFLFPWINGKNSLLQLLSTSMMGVGIFAWWKYFNYSYIFTTLVLCYVFPVFGFLDPTPVKQSDAVSFQSQLVNMYGLVNFDVIIHISSIPEGLRLLLAIIQQFLMTFISKRLITTNTVIIRKRDPKELEQASSTKDAHTS